MGLAGAGLLGFLAWAALDNLNKLIDVLCASARDEEPSHLAITGAGRGAPVL